MIAHNAVFQSAILACYALVSHSGSSVSSCSSVGSAVFWAVVPNHTQPLHFQKRRFFCTPGTVVGAQMALQMSSCRWKWPARAISAWGRPILSYIVAARSYSELIWPFLGEFPCAVFEDKNKYIIYKMMTTHWRSGYKEVLPEGSCEGLSVQQFYNLTYTGNTSKRPWLWKAGRERSKELQLHQWVEQSQGMSSGITTQLCC